MIESGLVDSADEWYAGVSDGYEVRLYMYLFAVGSFPCLDRFFPGSHACSSVVCELDFGVWYDSTNTST